MTRSFEVYSDGEDYSASEFIDDSTDEDNYTEEWQESNEQDIPSVRLEYLVGPPASYVVQLPQHKLKACYSFQELWETLSPLAKENTLILNLSRHL
jgi:hypothetical protein